MSVVVLFVVLHYQHCRAGIECSGAYKKLLCLPLSAKERMCHPDYQINAAVLNFLGVQQLDNENYPCPEGYCAIGLIEKGKSCCASNK